MDREIRACAIVIGAVLGASAGMPAWGQSAALRDTYDPARVEAQKAAAFALSDAFAAAAERIAPSVVHIDTKAERRFTTTNFFGERFQRRREVAGLGSGVVLSGDGLILTNNHVVEGATQLMVRLSDGREHEATLLGTDPARDLALLDIEAEGLTPARFADSDALRVGQWVLAAGSPFGISNTVTAGIVSATARTGLGIVNPGLRDGEEFIQTDAAINPGNSGGPLIDLDGRVVGINTAIFSRTGGSVGLGFAIPANLAQSVADNLRSEGRVEEGWLGVGLQNVTPELAGSFGYDGPGGVLVTEVVESSPADRAGLEPGDLIARFRDKPVENYRVFVQNVKYIPPGSEASLVVFREGMPIQKTVTLGGRDEYLSTVFRAQRVEELGVWAAAMSGLDESQRRYRDLDGVMILDVHEGSVADRLGLRTRDVVVGVGRLDVRSPGELERLATPDTLNRGARLRVVRDGRRGYLVLK